MMRAAVIAAMLLAVPARAQDAGEPYHGLRNIRNGECCGPSDCRAADDVRYIDHGFEVLWRGQWLPVMDFAISPTPSWDGRYHVCIRNPYDDEPYVVCFIQPGSV